MKRPAVPDRHCPVSVVEPHAPGPVVGAVPSLSPSREASARRYCVESDVLSSPRPVCRRMLRICWHPTLGWWWNCLWHCWCSAVSLTTCPTPTFLPRQQLHSRRIHSRKIQLSNNEYHVKQEYISTDWFYGTHGCNFWRITFYKVMYRCLLGVVNSQKTDESTHHHWNWLQNL